MYRLLHPRVLAAGRRLGLGAGVSTAAHAALLVLLVLLVTRGGLSPVDGDGTEGDRVDVSTIGDPGLLGDAPSEAVGAAKQPPATPPPRPRRAAAAPVRLRSATSAGTGAAAAGAGPARPPTRTLASTTPRPPEAERALLPAKAGPSGASLMAAFRSELKQRMRAAWRAREVYERIDPHGRMQGALLITKLNVRVRADGTVEKAELRDSSGIAALDTEASAAIQRMKPLSPLPREIVDDHGGILVRCAFHLDLGLFRFANQLHHAIGELWSPGKAFMMSGDRERISIVQLTLNRQGMLEEAKVMQSAGIDFLDKNALGWTRPGLALPAPPTNFMRGASRIPIYVAFAHLSGRFIVKDPEEDLDAD